MKRENRGKVCVVVAENTVAASLHLAKQQQALADVIEIRLDTLCDPAIQPFMNELSAELLFTMRPTWEGGNFAGAEERRLDFLVEAVAAGAAYVDLELDAPEDSRMRLREAIAAGTTRLILSHHDFAKTPDTKKMLRQLHRIKENGAQIAKLITMAYRAEDVLRVLALQEKAAELELDLIAFCMGEAGKISRLATLYLGGFMSYCTVSSGKETAPGQLPFENFMHIQKLLG